MVRLSQAFGSHRWTSRKGKAHMKREFITPPGAQSKAAFSPEIKIGNLLYTSGKVGIDREIGNIPEDVSS